MSCCETPHRLADELVAESHALGGAERLDIASDWRATTASNSMMFLNFSRKNMSIFVLL